MRRRLILHETGLKLAKGLLLPTSATSSILQDIYFLFVSELIWPVLAVSDDEKYVCGRGIYACIKTRKFNGLDCREIILLPEIKKVIYMLFQSSPKINRMLITRRICIQ